MISKGLDRSSAGPWALLLVMSLISSFAVARAALAAPQTAEPQNPPAPPLVFPPMELPEADPTHPPPPPPPALEPPTASECDALAADLALLASASTRQVTIPKDAKTLAELFEALAVQSDLRIDPQWEILAEFGIRRDDTPPATRGSGSLLAVLDALCVSLGEVYQRPRVEASLGALRMTSTAGSIPLRATRLYETGALTDAFLEQAYEHVDPDAWTRFGGDLQHATRTEGAVLVSAPPSSHHRLGLLLESLRRANPAGWEMSAVILSVPTQTFRALSMAPDAGEKLTPMALAQLPGVESVATPTIVAAMDKTASMAQTRGSANVVLSFRPERSSDEGTLVHVHFEVEAGGATSSSDGTLPAPASGPPALIALEIPGTDRSMTVFLRARPLPRPMESASP